MKTARYVCTHCGKKFEAEEKDVLECPSCFWSTSVKKEEDVRETPFKFAAPPRPKKTFAANALPFLAVILVLLTGIFFFSLAAPFVKGMLKEKPAREESAGDIRPPAETKAEPKAPKAGPKPVSKLLPKFGKKEKDAPAAPAQPAAEPSLTEEEKNILGRRLDISADREPNEAENKILKARAPFSSGVVEKLPSQAWTLDNYKKMIADQERFYKVPLPGSYKKKLYTLFQEKYAPAADAFKEDKLLEARNLWVESLEFPIFANDIKKHRGVVLTMLRGFINDTLSKIGAINTALADSKIRSQERKITEDYERLVSQLDKKSWQDAYSTIQELQQVIDGLQKPGAGQQVEPYPAAALPKIDDGIRNGLFEVMNVPPASVADLEPMERDLLLKRKVTESFLPANLEPVKLQYNEALDLIGQKKWADAEAKLKEIVFPEALAEDAKEKIKVLRKLQNAPQG